MAKRNTENNDKRSEQLRIWVTPEEIEKSKRHKKKTVVQTEVNSFEMQLSSISVILITIKTLTSYLPLSVR